MQRTISRLMYGFLAVFLVAVAAMAAYQAWVIFPRDRCEKEQGGWWDSESRKCGRVIFIPDRTGRYVDRQGRPIKRPDRSLPGERKPR